MNENASEIRNELTWHVDLEAAQLVGPVFALVEQTPIELDLRNVCRRTGCKVAFRVVGWRVRQRDCDYRGVNYPFGKVVSMHFLRVASVCVEEQPRKRPTGYLQEHSRSGTSSSSSVFSHHHADRSTVTTRPTALTSLSGGPRWAKSDNRCCHRAARRSRFHLRDGELASGRRGQSEVSSRTAMISTWFGRRG